MTIIEDTFLFFIMMLCGGGTGSDALDYVDSEHYWKTKKVEYTVEEMMLEAKKPDVPKDAAPMEAQIRRLLAIRSLGEMKAQKALPLLKEFVESKESFVADYAKEAIARIEGKAVPKIGSQDRWKKSIRMAPADTSGIIHLKLERPANFKRLKEIQDSMVDLLGVTDGCSDEEIDEQMQQEIKEAKAEIEQSYIDEVYPFLEKVGNIRVESITITLADKFTEEKGWVAVILKGDYNKGVLTDFLKQSMEDDEGMVMVKGAPFFSINTKSSIGFLSDTTMVYAFGPNRKSLPLQAMVEGLERDKPIYSAELNALVKKTNKKGPTWASMLLLNEFKEEEEFYEPFTTLRLETKREKDSTHVKITCEGDDAKSVSASIRELEKEYATFLKEEVEQLEEDIPRSLQSFIPMAKSFTFLAKDKEGLIQAHLPRMDSRELLVMSVGFFIGMQEMAEMPEVPAIPEMELEVEPDLLEMKR